MKKVSIHCITFGRPHRLEHVLGCFHKQDYQGPKELVILNDVEEQTLVYEHPEVKIINAPKYYDCIGKKRNDCIAQCSGDVILTLDDDDVILSNHISTCVDILGDDDYTAPGCGLTIVKNYAEIERVNSGLMAQMVYTKELWHRTKYPEENFGEDRGLIYKLMAEGKGKWANLPASRATYLFAWDNGDNHLQGFGPERPEVSGVKIMRMHLKQAIAEGKQPSGRIVLKPNYSIDYDAMVKNFLIKNNLL